MEKMKAVLATLESHAVQHDLVNRAKLGFQTWLTGDLADGTVELPGGWSVKQLEADLESINLCFRPAEVDYPFVDTRLAITRGGVVVGHYRLITRLDGSNADDYFVLDAES